MFSKSTVLMLSLVSLAVGAAQAGTEANGRVLTTPEGLRYQIVSVADLNLATVAGAVQADTRLRNAAKRVCQQPTNSTRAISADEKRCMHNAIAHAARR